MFVAAAGDFDAVKTAVAAFGIVPAFGYVAFDRSVLVHNVSPFSRQSRRLNLNYGFYFVFYTGIC